MSDLKEFLESVRDRLHQVKHTAESVGDSNTPNPEQLASVEAELDAAEQELNTIHDPNLEPSLDPPSAGQVQSPSIPTSRLQVATYAATWSEEAHEEASSSAPNTDYDYIGDRTRTLVSVFIPEIREDFGLT